MAPLDTESGQPASYSSPELIQNRFAKLLLLVNGFVTEYYASNW